MKKIFLLMVFAITVMWQKSNAQSWNLSGNSGTTTSNYIGTSDGNDLRLKTNGSTRMTITSAGYAGIGATPETNSRLYTYFSVPSIITQDVVRSAMRSRVYGSSATRANGYLGAHYNASGSNLVNLPVSLNYMGVLGIKEDADDFGAGVVGWNKSNNAGGNNYGMYGVANGIASGFSNISDRNIGVYGSAAGNYKNIAIYGNSPGSSDWAGYFIGRGYFSDKLGIGVEDPTSMLTIDAPSSTAVMSLRSNGSTKMYLNSSGYLGLGTTAQTSVLEINAPVSASPFKLSVNGSAKLFVSSAGKLGIGTTTPSARLHIKTTTDADCGYFSNFQSTTAAITGVNVLSQNLNGATFGVAANANGTGENYAVVGKSITNGTSNFGVWGEASIGNTGAAYGVYATVTGGSTNTPVYAVYGTSSGSANHWAGYFNGTTYTSTLRVGTTNSASGYIASIGGKLICEEVRVALEADWPDYVFADDHNLMPLEELKTSLKENKHLPGIPSAADVQKSGGFELGEMQQKLLEKVEELTLYVIKLNDENKDLRNQMEQLKK